MNQDRALPEYDDDGYGMVKFPFFWDISGQLGHSGCLGGVCDLGQLICSDASKICSQYLPAGGWGRSRVAGGQGCALWKVTARAVYHQRKRGFQTPSAKFQSDSNRIVWNPHFELSGAGLHGIKMHVYPCKFQGLFGKHNFQLH